MLRRELPHLAEWRRRCGRWCSAPRIRSRQPGARCICCWRKRHAVTPFGARLRALREARGVSQAALAAALHVSPAYLSALEHGHRGRPSPGLIHQVNEFFGLIWDDAEEMVRLARLSHPRMVLDTAGLSAGGDGAGQPPGAGYPAADAGGDRRAAGGARCAAAGESGPRAGAKPGSASAARRHALTRRRPLRMPRHGRPTARRYGGCHAAWPGRSHGCAAAGNGR